MICLMIFCFLLSCEGFQAELVTFGRASKIWEQHFGEKLNTNLSSVKASKGIVGEFLYDTGSENN